MPAGKEVSHPGREKGPLPNPKRRKTPPKPGGRKTPSNVGRSETRLPNPGGRRAHTHRTLPPSQEGWKPPPTPLNQTTRAHLGTAEGP